MLLGAGALLPLLFLEKITSYISWIDVLSTFARAENLGGFILGFIVFVLFFSLLFLYSQLFSFSSFFKNFQKLCIVFLSVVCILGSMSVILFCIFLLYSSSVTFQSLQVFDFPSFQGIWFDTALLVALYYFIVATLEEGSKYFMSLQNQDQEENHPVSYILLGALFVALGFAFIENIFYTYRFLSNGFSGVFGVMIFRSLFSTLLHVICTVVFFSGSMYLFKKNTQNRYHFISKSAFFGICAIMFHTFYNMSLAYGYLSIVIVAIVAGYFYLSYLFTRN